MKIAVCDDSREDRGAFKALLEACGHDFEIREYGSGAELYADMGYVRECGIVFLDINMEGMDGLEAAGKIKAECPKVHIVLVTAYVNYALDGYKVKASRFLLRMTWSRRCRSAWRTSCGRSGWWNSASWRGTCACGWTTSSISRPASIRMCSTWRRGRTASTRRWMSWRRNWRGWVLCGYTRASSST